VRLKDGQTGSNPQPGAKLGEKSDSLRNQAIALIENLLVNLSPGSLGACKPCQSLAVKLRFNPPRNWLTGSASRSESTPGTRMLRECPTAFRSARAVAEVDSPGEGVHSTAQRHHPSPLPGSGLRFARKG